MHSSTRILSIAGALFGLSLCTPVNTQSATVTKLTKLTDDAGRVDWSERLNLIAFDRRFGSEYYDVATMRPDGSGMKCLTCDRSELPPRHKGNPSWHPSGDFIIFQAEKDLDLSQGQSGRRRGRLGGGRRGSRKVEQLEKLVDFVAAPGAGFRNDLWLMNRDGTRYWKLHESSPRGGGVLHPHFNSRGDKVFWAERVSNGDGHFGLWVMKVADFVGGSRDPRLNNIRTLTPGQKRRFYESHGFSPDGSKIIFTADPERTDRQLALDIYTYDLNSNRLTNLTDSPDAWDEHAHFSPSGKKIVWMSSEGTPLPDKPGDVKCEWWMMDADGSNKQRLTGFNSPGNPEFEPGGACAADLAWSPDGRSIMGYLILEAKTRRGKIVRLDFDRAY